MAQLTYCIPNETGLGSYGPAVAKRIARLLRVLEYEVNESCCAGQINNDVRALRQSIMAKLKAEGWHIRIDEQRYSVQLPKGYLDGAYGKGKKNATNH